jgi:hypothetical protein
MVDSRAELIPLSCRDNRIRGRELDNVEASKGDGGTFRFASPGRKLRSLRKDTYDEIEGI